MSFVIYRSSAYARSARMPAPQSQQQTMARVGGIIPYQQHRYTRGSQAQPSLEPLQWLKQPNH